MVLSLRGVALKKVVDLFVCVGEPSVLEVHYKYILYFAHVNDGIYEIHITDKILFMEVNFLYFKSIVVHPSQLWWVCIWWPR